MNNITRLTFKEFNDELDSIDPENKFSEEAALILYNKTIKEDSDEFLDTWLIWSMYIERDKDVLLLDNIDIISTKEMDQALIDDAKLDEVLKFIQKQRYVVPLKNGRYLTTTTY